MATASSFVPEDVMKLFAQSFASGTNAILGAERNALAAQGQAQEFRLGQQKLALQSQELQGQEQNNAAKIALQREEIAASSALKGQQISMQQQELAKNFLMQEQKMNQDRLNFAEQIRATKAAEESKRLQLALSVDNLEKQNKFEEAKIGVEREKIKAGIDYKEVYLQEQKQKQDEAVQFKRMQAISQQVEFIKKEAGFDPGNSAQVLDPKYTDSTGQLDINNKVVPEAIARVDRLGNTPVKPVDTTGNSQQSPSQEKGILDRLVDKFKEGRVYTDKKGKKAVYKDGKFVPL